MTNADKMEKGSFLNEYINWEAECKEKTALWMIGLINDICADLEVQYFAIGDLLEDALTGGGIDPADDILQIALLRPDYDKFVDHIRTKTVRKDKTLSFNDTYSKSGTIKRKTASLSCVKEYHGSAGEVTITCSIKLIPLDILPNDSDERHEFIEEVVHETKEYLQQSARINSYRTQDSRSTLLKRIINRGRAFIFRGGFRDKYRNKREDYHSLLTKYSETSDPQYIGRLELGKGLVATYDQVFPCKQIYIKGTPIYFPNDIEYFSDQFGSKDFQKLLEERLRLLREFDEYCTENGLEYTLGWDLSIAVVSGKDFDEDTVYSRWDVCLPREDYNRLVEMVRGDRTPLRLLETDPGMPTTTSSDRRITLNEFASANSFLSDYPICLVPIDHLPDNYKEGSDLCVAAKAAAERLNDVIVYEKGGKFVKLHPAENSRSDFDKLQEICSSCSDSTKRVFAIRKRRVFVEEASMMFPPQRWEFRDFAVSVPANEYCWHDKKDPKYVEYITDKKTVILEKMDRLCADNDIAYFAISSLLIGATIYHDIIPDEVDHAWDIALLRDDYKRLLDVLAEKGEEYGLDLQTHYDEEKKLPVKRKRILDRSVHMPDVYIKLVPFDKVPLDFYLGNGLENMLQEKNEFYRQLLYAKRFPYRKLNIPFKGQKLKDCENYIATSEPDAEYEAIDKLAQSYNDTDRPFKYEGICFSKTKSLRERDLFPLRREKFRGIYINCPKDTSPWQPVINEELNHQVECIQRAAIVLLQEFDKACEKLGLGYFICGGTMLGYVRHGGFIPWDDDIDVAMLREDYEKFISQAASVLPDTIFLQTRETDKTIPYLFSKIRLKDTEYVTEYSMVREYHQGICLDIFPFDYLPNGKVARSNFVKEVKQLAKIHHVVARNQLSPSEEKPVPRNDIERECLKFEEDLLSASWGMDLAKTQADYLKVATRYNADAKKDGLTTVASFVPSYTYIDLNDLLPYQRGIFQGIEVSVPKRPDIFLEMQYGDYMALPPEHNRIAHRLVRWRTWEGSGGIATDGDDE